MAQLASHATMQGTTIATAKDHRLLNNNSKENQSALYSVALPLAAIVCYTFVFYYEILASPIVQIFRDAHSILIPMEQIARLFSGSDWPALWNPFTVLGKPFAVEPVSGVFYPPNWVFRFFEQPFGWNLSIATHHIIAASGFFFFLREKKVAVPAAVFASILFSFGGIFVSLDNMINALQSSSWLPWALWAFVRWIDLAEVKFLIATCVFMVFIYLGGMPEVLVYANIFFVFFCSKAKSKTLVLGY